jgi:hypothetical protein
MPKGKAKDPLDPKFLIKHAKGLTTSSGSGRPPTIDARRAASAAYYAAYHAATGAVSELLFGEQWLHGVRWLSHKAVTDASRLVSRLGPLNSQQPSGDPDRVRDRSVWSIFQEIGGAQPDLLNTMEGLRSLRAEREIADYDRVQHVPRATARALVGRAEFVKAFFESQRAADPDTRVFLALVALKT